MPRLVCLAVWLLLSLQAVAAELRVVTWNLQWFPGRSPYASKSAQDRQIRMAQAVLKKLDPDILLLQEIRNWAAAETLLEALPGTSLCTISAFEERSQQVAIATRLPCDSAWYAPWKAGPDAEPPRGYAFAALRLPDGTFLLTYSVHLKSNLGNFEDVVKMREESARQILAHAKDMANLYDRRAGSRILVGGDFNTGDAPAFRADRTLEILRQGRLKWVFEGVPFERRHTIEAAGEFPANCFDQIFSWGLRLRSVEVVNNGGASDHKPVLAIFDLPQPALQTPIAGH